MPITAVQTILFVADQQISRDFYSRILGLDPITDVPGMIEFRLPGMLLGLMPETGIARILRGATPNPASGNGIPRCELYLHCTNVEAAYKQALAAGASAISPAQPRDWGDLAAYVGDLDGHIIAFASKIQDHG